MSSRKNVFQIKSKTTELKLIEKVCKNTAIDWELIDVEKNTCNSCIYNIIVNRKEKSKQEKNKLLKS